jgi:large subunit ribosomal protein L31
MKEGIHPNYRPVVFQDISTGEMIVTRSCVNAKDTIQVDGETLPLVRLEVSSFSHPFYTGKQSLVDTEGRVEKFKNKYEFSL